MNEAGMAADVVMRGTFDLVIIMLRALIQFVQKAAALIGAVSVFGLKRMISRQSNKISGRTSMKSLKRRGIQLQFLQLSKEQFKEFKKRAKKNGILYTARENSIGTYNVFYDVSDFDKVDHVKSRIDSILYKRNEEKTREKSSERAGKDTKRQETRGFQKSKDKDNVIVTPLSKDKNVLRLPPGNERSAIILPQLQEAKEAWRNLRKSTRDLFTAPRLNKKIDMKNIQKNFVGGEVYPMTPAQFKDFSITAKKEGLKYLSVLDNRQQQAPIKVIVKPQDLEAATKVFHKMNPDSAVSRDGVEAMRSKKENTLLQRSLESPEKISMILGRESPAGRRVVQNERDGSRIVGLGTKTQAERKRVIPELERHKVTLAKKAKIQARQRKKSPLSRITPIFKGKGR